MGNNGEYRNLSERGGPALRACWGIPRARAGSEEEKQEEEEEEDEDEDEDGG